ncbi:hypothetical protein [Dankookia sp. P2]|uniref:hypothetical protein n=1 Tax=Dankookia sp. P2 TaxID=3423955 RepID=UPI003D66D932
MRGLPLGTGLFWLASFPLFAAGLGFGAAAAVVGGLLATLLIALVQGGFATVTYLVLFGVPAPLLMTTALRSGRLSLSLPLALLGLWPLLVLLATAAFLADDGGLEAAMRDAMAASLTRLGVPAPEEFVAALVRVKAGAIGFWAAVSLLANAVAAVGFLAKRQLLAVPRPDWAAVRLPGWYPLLPAMALGLLLAMPADSDILALSALLLLVVPLFLQGVAGVHTRLRGARGRRPMLAGFYLLLVLFLQVMGPGLVALGLYDQFLRRPAPRQS